MKAVNILACLVLAGSVAVAQQSSVKPAAQKAGPLAISHPTAARTTPAVDKNAPEPKVTKEQAGTTALGTMKGAELVGSDLKTVNGKQVWAVTLKSNKHNRTVLVDAADGSVVPSKTKHTMHTAHKKAADQARHSDQAPRN